MGYEIEDFSKPAEAVIAGRRASVVCSDLLGCPFCGSRPKLEWKDVPVTDGDYAHKRLYWFVCDGVCGAGMNLGEWTIDEAAAKWNRRVQPNEKLCHGDQKPPVATKENDR